MASIQAVTIQSGDRRYHAQYRDASQRGSRRALLSTA
jgi:hypothetical protein